MCIKAYTLGLKHGKQLSNAIVPKIDLNPSNTLKQHLKAREIKKKDDLTQEGIFNVANYDPYEVKEGE